MIVQEPVCSSAEDLECVKKFNIDSSNCLKPCSGLIVTSFSKFSVTKGLENLVPILKDYNNFKTLTEYPAGQTGKYSINSIYEIKSLSNSHFEICNIQIMNGRTQ